jgi:hypothetical protein
MLRTEYTGGHVSHLDSLPLHRVPMLKKQAWMSVCLQETSTKWKIFGKHPNLTPGLTHVQVQHYMEKN